MKPFIKLFLPLALSVLSTQSMGGVYKWTDSEGVTHYGDKKPSNYESQAIKMREHKSQPSAPQEKNNSEKSTTPTAETKKTSTNKPLSPQAQQAKQKNCEAARKNLKIIEENSRIRMEVDGEMKFLTSEEIDAQKKRLEEVVQENCN